MIDGGDGVHTFAVRAVDRAGTAGDAASYAWTLDTVAPTISFGDMAGFPQNPTNKTDAHFLFHATDERSGVAGVTCILDGVPDAGPCSSESSQDYAQLAPNKSYIFKVYSTDKAGNTVAPVSYPWLIDTEPPTTEITKGPPTPGNSPNVAFVFASKDRLTFIKQQECWLDDQSLGLCSSTEEEPYLVPVTLGEGNHKFEVGAEDVADNQGDKAPYEFFVDLIPPGTGHVECPPDPSGSRRTEVLVTTTEAVKSFECNTDNVGFVECDIIDTDCNDALPPVCMYSLQVKLLDTQEKPLEGAHHLEIRAKDEAGNVDPEPVSCDWNVVIHPPAAPVITEPSSDEVVIGPTVTLRGTSGSAGAVNLYIRQGDNRTPLGSVPISNGEWEYSRQFEVGEYTVEVDVTDLAENTGPATSVHFSVVAPKPVGTAGGGGIGCTSFFASSSEPWFALLGLLSGTAWRSRRRRR
jgi:hypothetical protein